MSVSARRTRKSVALVLLACTSMVPMVLAACKQAPPAVVDAGPPPVATDAAPAILAPLEEDAGPAIDASDAAAPHHGPGGALNTNQVRAKQCCAALAKQAGTDPSLGAMVLMCNQVAAQMGPSAGGQAPEFAAVRNALKGKTIPAVCSGL